jgi:thymidylate synthase (FAD)
MSPLVKLVSITPDAQHLIAYCARVSNPSNQQNLDTEEKLLRYLIDHNHWSPFEMANMVVEINTTRAIAPQILRHRSFSFQEFSQRYADVTTIGSPIMPTLRRQDKANRQNSIDDLTCEKTQGYYSRIRSLFADSEDLYKEMVSNGVAKESARAVLPLASPTRLYMNGTIRSWIHYCDLRMSVETQKEHREIALNVMELLCQELPAVAMAMWKHN